MFKRRRMLAVAAAVMGSLLAIGFQGGCPTLDAKIAMESIQPCGIFDCTGGLLGGAINPCGQPNNPADDVLNGCP